MSDNLFQNRYRIPSARANWHNYNGGIYFVTICTRNREHYFGNIVETWCTAFPHTGINTVTGVETCCTASLHPRQLPQMILSPIGEYADEQFRNVQNHYPYAIIPSWVVMPDHVHAIVEIDHNRIPYERRDVNAFHGNDIVSGMGTWAGASPQQIANMQGWLSVVIGGLKRSVTHFANLHRIPFVWQTRFHDRIIRNAEEMDHFVEYIDNNVANWEHDKSYNRGVWC